MEPKPRRICLLQNVDNSMLRIGFLSFSRFLTSNLQCSHFSPSSESVNGNDNNAMQRLEPSNERFLHKKYLPEYQYFHYEKTLGQFLQCSAWDWDSVIVLLFSFCYNSQQKLMLAELREELRTEQILLYIAKYLCGIQCWSLVHISVSHISLQVLTSTTWKKLVVLDLFSRIREKNVAKK